MSKKLMAGFLLVGVISCIGAVFWQQELVYQLPTPIPKDYTPVATGALLDLPETVHTQAGKPVLLHFFNPECPCSRFNLKHFLTLVRQHRKDLNFVAVIPEKEDLAKAHRMLDGEVPVVHDVRQQLSRQCGVYASPQAVLVDSEGRLFYKGNYNRARYCTQKKTSYAALAIEHLLAHQPAPVFDTLATRAYGCQLPDRN